MPPGSYPGNILIPYGHIDTYDMQGSISSYEFFQNGIMNGEYFQIRSGMVSTVLINAYFQNDVHLPAGYQHHINSHQNYLQHSVRMN